MAMTAFQITAPAIAAAVGFYFFDKIDTKVIVEAQRPPATKVGSEVTKRMKKSRVPKLAPQFDGLYTFETLVD